MTVSQSEPPCTKPWNNIIVYADGGVRFCCFLRHDLGNLITQEFHEIWNCRVAKEIRRELIGGRIHDECKDCPLVRPYATLLQGKS
jgi:radical SAM protein with 4Fe4S-binding SPASM domain